MGTVAVLGASGHTGGWVAAELVRAGHRPVLAAPDAQRLRARLAELEVEAAGDLRRADATRPTEMDAVLDGVDVLVNVAGPYERCGRGVLEAALRTGTHYLDAAAEPGFVAWALSADERARRAGVTAVVAGGLPTVPLDLLAHLAVGAVRGADEVQLATTFPSRGGLRAGAGPATRAVLADMLECPAGALVDGRQVAEPLGEARRLAWFPRPVGLAHAAGVGGAGPLTVPRHAPHVRTVRQHLAMAGWRAELLQLAGSLARWEPARRRLARLVRGAGAPPVPAAAAGVRWACVAETRGEEGVARAWANGHDPARTTAIGLVVLAEAVLAGAAPAGVLPPAAVSDPTSLLDGCSARGALRWALVRPE